MSPEDPFKKWWNDLKNLNAVVPHVAAKLAWLEATRQAYEDAVRICEREKLIYPSGQADDIAYEMAISDCIRAIQARLKELSSGPTKEKS